MTHPTQDLVPPSSDWDPVANFQPPWDGTGLKYQGFIAAGDLRPRHLHRHRRVDPSLAPTTLREGPLPSAGLPHRVPKGCCPLPRADVTGASASPGIRRASSKQPPSGGREQDLRSSACGSQDPGRRQAVHHRAASLSEAEHVDTAERLERAYDRKARIVALDIPDREAILRKLSDLSRGTGGAAGDAGAGASGGSAKPASGTGSPKSTHGVGWA